MPAFALRFVGQEALPPRLSEFDREQFFTLTSADVAAIREQFRSDHRLPGALMPMFMRVAGRPLDGFNVLPRNLLRHTAQVLGVSPPSIASLRSIYKRRQTLSKHQHWAKNYLGLRELELVDEAALTAALLAQAADASHADDLVQSASHWLFTRRILIPGARRLQDWARDAFAAVEAQILSAVSAAVPPAGVAIEGIEQHNSAADRIRISPLAVDTHGYANPAMAIAKLLGFDLCPRLRDLAERKLYLPRGFSVPDGLEAVAVRRVSLAAIERGWDELLRLAASIRSGRVSATLALQRFGSAAHGDPLHRAAEHMGRLLRTVFLCDYIAIEDFRREIHTLLNRGESVHQLQRAVYSGKLAPERGRRREEMKAISGSHALLTNIVLAWNTARMHEVVERLKRDGIPVEDDWLRRIGPAHFSHINFRGTMKFGVEKFAVALIQRVPGQATRMAS